MTDSRIKAKVEPTQCLFCNETLAPESVECQNGGSNVSLFSPAALGWVTVADYAASTSTSIEAVLSAIQHGDLDGQLICGNWFVLNES
jgi:hypothetical protein